MISRYLIVSNIQDQLFDKNLRGSEASGSSQKLCDAEIQLGQLRLIPPGLGLLVLVVGYEVA